MNRLLLGFAAVALFVGSLIVAPLTSEVAGSICPPGSVVDSGSAGFACVPRCPSGTLLDARTETCVAATFDPPML